MTLYPSQRILAVLVVLQVFHSAEAQAGPLGEFFKWSARTLTERQAIRKAAQEQAHRRAMREYADRRAARRMVEQQAARKAAEQQSAREAAERVAQRRAEQRSNSWSAIARYSRNISAGTMTLGTGALISQLAQAGYEPNPVQLEQRAVFEEMVLEIQRGTHGEVPSYTPKLCQHPRSDHFYPVPEWTTHCSDGSMPRIGQPMQLGGLVVEKKSLLTTALD